LAPLLILHGANYYDSTDWIEIAAQLADDREVVTYDYRGYGESSWSPSRDYSIDATLNDIQSLLRQLGWARAVLIGHSRGGLVSLRFGERSPERIAGLLLVDYSPGQVTGRSRIEPTGLGPLGPIYKSLEDAHAATSRNSRELESKAGRNRVESIFAERDGGWVNVKRDPEFQNDGSDRGPRLAASEPWDAFSVVARTQSTSYDEAALSRLRLDFGVDVSDIDSGHDIPGTAPDELVAVVRGFLHSNDEAL
jgi:esterase